MNCEFDHIVEGVHRRIASRVANWHRSRYLPILRVLGVLCGSYSWAVMCSAEGIRTWAFEATIIANGDPLFRAADVRLGDTIRGTFSYDLSLAPDPGGAADYGTYSHPPGYQGIHLAIENPRTDTHLEYVPRIDAYSEFWIDVWTYDDANPDDDESGLTLYQVPIPPNPEWFDFIYLGFTRPGLSTDLSLPSMYSLDDWEQAWIWHGPIRGQ